MKFRWKLVAQLLIPILLVIAAINGWAIKKKLVTSTGLDGQIAQTQRELRRLEMAGKNLEAIPRVIESETKGIEQNAMEALRLLYANRAKYDVSINSIGTDKPLGPTGLRPIDEMVQPIGGTNLKFAKLVIKGKYMDYVGFLNYLNEIHSLPVAISAIKATAQEFEIELRAYGT